MAGANLSRTVGNASGMGLVSGEWDWMAQNQDMRQLGTTFKNLGKSGNFLAIEELGVTAALLENAYIQKMEGAMPDWFNDDPGWLDGLHSAMLGFTSALDNSAAGFSSAIYEAGSDFGSDIRMAGDSLAGRLGGIGGGGGRSGGFLSGLGDLFGFFHDGGWPRAHDGLWLGRNEIPIIAEEGERVVSRREVAQAGGRRRLDALLNGGSDRGINININVNALDGDSVSRLDWERLVRSRVAPVLDKLNRRKV